LRTYCRLSDGRKWRWKKNWNRKRWVLLLEIFMYSYFGTAYILSWDETTSFYILLSILITLERKRISWMKVSAQYDENTFKSTDCLHGKVWTCPAG
jgi:hypothetical protein